MMLLKIPGAPYTCHYLTFRNVNVGKQAIVSKTNVMIRPNDKSQGSVAAYSRCGEILSNHITTNSLLNLPVIFGIAELLSVTGTKLDCFVHFVCLTTNLLKDFIRHLEFGEKQLFVNCCYTDFKLLTGVVSDHVDDREQRHFPVTFVATNGCNRSFCHFCGWAL